LLFLTVVILSCFTSFEKPSEMAFLADWTVSSKEGKINCLLYTFY